MHIQILHIWQCHVALSTLKRKWFLTEMSFHEHTDLACLTMSCCIHPILMCWMRYDIVKHAGSICACKDSSVRNHARFNVHNAIWHCQTWRFYIIYVHVKSVQPDLLVDLSLVEAGLWTWSGPAPIPKGSLRALWHPPLTWLEMLAKPDLYVHLKTYPNFTTSLIKHPYDTKADDGLNINYCIK